MHDPITSGVRRADQVFYEQVGEKTTLQHGIAFHDVEYPQSTDDNAFREVLIEDPAALPDAWAEAEQFYESRGLCCCRWVPALGQPAELLAPFLQRANFRRQPFTVMYLPDWPELASAPDVRVLPARAMRQAFRDLHPPPDHADLEERRLDYAQFDVFVATLDGHPAGRCGLLQVGEIANIRNLYVAEPFRRRHIGRTLLATTLELAHRLMMKIVCCKVDATNAPGIAFLKSCGLQAGGQLVEFERIAHDPPDAT